MANRVVACEAQSLAELQELALFDRHCSINTIQSVIDLQLLLDTIRGVTEVFGRGFNS